MLLLASFGCGSPPGVYRPWDVWGNAPVLDEDAPQIQEGRPNIFLDGLSHYLFSLPTKLLLWNWHVLDHELPEENEIALDHYLELNGLHSVKVRHNQYDPIGEMRRLTKNGDVGVGYRIVLGGFSWLRYTLIPDRLFGGLPLIGGGDHFNPYSNSINVYSSDLAILLHEGGHAKDYARTEHKGTMFALPRLLPGVDLYQEATASTDAVRFLNCVEDPEGEVDSYKTLTPAYFTYVGGSLPGSMFLYGGFVLFGHAGGRIQAHNRQQQIDEGDPNQIFTPPEWCGPIPGSLASVPPPREREPMPPLPEPAPLTPEAPGPVSPGSEPPGSERPGAELVGPALPEPRQPEPPESEPPPRSPPPTPPLLEGPPTGSPEPLSPGA